MPEPNVLYAVTAVVVLGLAAWVAFVLKTAKKPWARPGLAQAGPARPPDTAVEPEQAEEAEEPEKDEVSARGREASEKGEPERKDGEG